MIWARPTARSVACTLELSLTGSDSGQGFDFKQAKKNGGKGINNQLSRAEAIGGNALWQSGMNGTNFLLWLPLRQSGA